VGEQGFTYPLSLCILVFFSLFLLILVDQNMVERRFLAETEKILVSEYYLQLAVIEAEQQLDEQKLDQKGSFEYKRGEVNFVRKVLTQGVEEITFTLRLETGEQWIGVAHYDWGKRQLVKWIEKN